MNRDEIFGLIEKVKEIRSKLKHNEEFLSELKEQNIVECCSLKSLMTLESSHLIPIFTKIIEELQLELKMYLTKLGLTKNDD